LAKLTDIVIITDSGGTQTLTIQNYAESDELQFWGSTFDEAIDGTLRSNVRGIRRKVELTYQLCTTPDDFRSVCNNIATDLINGAEFVYIGIDTDNVFRVVLDDGFEHRVQYANQHGLFIPKLVFRSTEGDVDIIIDFEDWRFITESVTEARDYRLITESVTGTPLDYGFII
jgi:hypothetical protein